MLFHHVSDLRPSGITHVNTLAELRLLSATCLYPCLAFCTKLTAAFRTNNYLTGVQLPGVVSNSFGVPGVNATYDYIIVGGGTGGLTIAARLAQNFSVAVVEAGGFYEFENGNGTLIPALATSNGISPVGPLLPLIDWGFQTVPQPEVNNRTIYYARGKTLGGSSARNFLAYHRPTIGSMQQWAEEVGDEGYLWDNVLPYFDRAVTITPANEAYRFANSSVTLNASVMNDAQDGPLQVTWPNYAPPIYSWYYQAFNDSGFQPNDEAFLAGELEGIAYTASTMDPAQQQRSTSESTFLQQAMLETDIKVYCHALFKEVLFDSNNTATGIRVNAGGQDFYLNATGEVILSGGTFQSPQMLMVSGIGPSATLEKHNIQVRKDLPGVGQNMWDHVYFGTSWQVNLPTASMLLNEPEYAAQANYEYLTNQTGILTAGQTMLGWERLTERDLPNVTLSESTIAALSQFPKDWPQLEYLPASGGNPDPMDGKNYASISAALITPLSRGNITIKSADTSDPPVINPNYLSNPSDLEMLVNGYKRIRTIWNNLSNVTAGNIYAPSPNTTTDAEIEQYIRSGLTPVWHPASTCKMGRSNDTMAVVDSKAKVYGVQNLRVVDASAFPFLTPGHPQSVVYMLAEKIADDILNNT